MFSVADGECAFVAEVKNANAIVPKNVDQNCESYFKFLYDCSSGALSADTRIMYGCNSDD